MVWIVFWGTMLIEAWLSAGQALADLLWCRWIKMAASVHCQTGSISLTSLLPRSWALSRQPFLTCLQADQFFAGWPDLIWRHFTFWHRQLQYSIEIQMQYRHQLQPVPWPKLTEDWPEPNVVCLRIEADIHDAWWTVVPIPWPVCLDWLI